MSKSEWQGGNDFFTWIAEDHKNEDSYKERNTYINI